MRRGETLGLGRWGERLAVRMLRRRGFEVRARNWRCPEGEVDIVAARAGALYFVEVRTRRAVGAFAPELSLSPRKLARMEAVARRYLAACVDVDDPAWHLSLVAVEVDRRGRLRRLTFYADVGDEPTDEWLAPKEAIPYG